MLNLGRDKCPRLDVIAAVNVSLPRIQVVQRLFMAAEVDDLVSVVDTSKRTLQRLFNRYVGVSAKWVIQRYRLHEAIEEIGRGHRVDWVRLAIELGYFDQAHFIKDFKRFAGRTPHEYARGLENRKPEGKTGIAKPARRSGPVFVMDVHFRRT